MTTETVTVWGWKESESSAFLPASPWLVSRRVIACIPRRAVPTSLEILSGLVLISRCNFSSEVSAFSSLSPEMIQMRTYEVVGELYHFIAEVICSQERVDLGLERLELFSFSEVLELESK